MSFKHNNYGGENDGRNDREEQANLENSKAEDIVMLSKEKKEGNSKKVGTSDNST